MAQDPSAAPVLFDRSLLLMRQARALRLGPATFLLDRVVEDMAERLSAVMRDFTDAADVWTPGEGLRLPDARIKSLTRIPPADAPQEILPLAPQSLDLVLSALALQFVNDPPRAAAGRVAAGGHDRRRHADRTPAMLRGGGSRMRGRSVAARGAIR
jgi:hypothetical protein